VYREREREREGLWPGQPLSLEGYTWREKRNRKKKLSNNDDLTVRITELQTNNA